MTLEGSAQSIMKLYRAMKADEDSFPKVGRSARLLGVRVWGENRDIEVEEGGMVSPRHGGMSVALDDARNLPKHRRPPSLGGEGRDPVFSLDRLNLPPPLETRVDRYPHALVEPVQRCRLSEYEEALASTRRMWRLMNG